MKKGTQGQVYLPNNAVHGLRVQVVKDNGDSISVVLLQTRRSWKKGTRMLLRKWEFQEVRTDGS